MSHILFASEDTEACRGSFDARPTVASDIVLSARCVEALALDIVRSDSRDEAEAVESRVINDNL